MIKNIYTISDPDTELVFYVGASVNVIERAKYHMNANQDSSARLTIDEIVSKGKRPLFSIVDKIEESEDWRSLEIEWIIKLHELGHPIKNKQVKGFKNKDYLFDLVDVSNLKEAK